MHSAARFPTPVIVSRWSRARAKGAITRVDLGVERLDRALELLDVFEGEADEQGVMSAEAAPEGLPQLGHLAPQPALGERGEDVGVTFAGDERLAASPRPETPRMSEATEPSRMPASSRVLAIRWASELWVWMSRFFFMPLAVAGQVAHVADGGRRDEAAAQQAVLEELGQPGGVTHIGLAPGQDS